MKNYDCCPFLRLYETGVGRVGTKRVMELVHIQKKLMNSTQCCFTTMKSTKVDT